MLDIGLFDGYCIYAKLLAEKKFLWIDGAFRFAWNVHRLCTDFLRILWQL